VTSEAKYREINGALVRALPELRPRYEEERVAWDEEMGPHVVYADVLNPFLLELLESRGDDRGNTEDALVRAFAFLDELLAHHDPDYADVARTTVAEELEAHPKLLTRARRYMGPLMAEATRDSPGPRRPRRLRNR
jgi:hypothetical protein